MADFQELSSRRLTFELRDLRENRIADGLESLRDKSGADESSRVARTKRNHPSAPVLRDRQRNEIAHEIHDIPEVIVEPDAFDGIAADALAVLQAEAKRPADASMVRGIFRKRRRHDALADFGLDEHVGFPVMRLGPIDRPYIKRGVRPRRLCQVPDDASNPAITLHQADVSRLKVRCSRRPEMDSQALTSRGRAYSSKICIMLVCIWQE